ncbi:hypothetical protein JCM6882_004783 [Rhodosporidiobolus microsporus]
MVAQGNIASPDLLWLLIRKQTAYTHKRPGADRIFAVERGNVKGIHGAKYSGLSNSRTVDISANESGRGLTVTYKAADASPFAVKSALQKKDIKGGKKTAQRAIIDFLPETGREDLYQTALTRVDRILASQNPRKPQRVRAVRPVSTVADEE